jgi:hypothetical protein
MDSKEPAEAPTPIKQNDSKEMRSFLSGVTLRGAVTLQKALGINDETFRMVSGHALQDSRAFYLYGVLDEVLKAATAMLRWDGFLQNTEENEKEDKELADHITRVVQEAVQDEQHLWSRKLSELLCDLILFDATNSDEHFRLFLSCEHLDAYLGLQRDFQEFFGCKNLNAAMSIDSCLNIVKQCGKSIDLENVWFLNHSIDWNKISKPGRLFRSSRIRYKLALQKSSPDQKLTLRISYEHGYSVPSRSIHANIGGPLVKTTLKDIEIAFSHVAMSCILVILQVHKLTGVELLGDALLMNKVFEAGTDARNIVESIYGKDLEIGDLVFAYGKDLCIVTDKEKSEYGYSSYRVRYLSPAPLPEVPEDWFPARYVHLVVPRKSLREQLLKIFTEQNLPSVAIERLHQMTEKDLLDQMAATALKAFNEGAFDHLFSTHK